MKINILSLGFLQALNFGVTLLTLPYLTRVFGVSIWGKIVFAQLIIGYMVWISNWGFYLGAARKVSVNRLDKRKLSTIFSVTFTAQCLLTFFTFFVFFILLSFSSLTSDENFIFLTVSGLLIGNLLTPLWFFNGLEKIRESALIQISAKILAIPFIFIFVQNKKDVVTYLLINSFSAIIFGVLSIGWILKSGLIRWNAPRLSSVLKVIHDDFHLFTSALWGNLNSSLVPTFLGIFSGSVELGYYNIADRARGAAITILHPISHALFPRMCHLHHYNKKYAIVLLKRIALLLIFFSLCMSIGLLIFPRSILMLIGGNDYLKGTNTLMWISFTPLFSTISAFIIHQILIPVGEGRLYNKIMLYGLLLSSAIVIPLVQKYGAVGASITSLISEFFVMLLLIRGIIVSRKLAY